MSSDGNGSPFCFWLVKCVLVESQGTPLVFYFTDFVFFLLDTFGGEGGKKKIWNNFLCLKSPNILTQ